MERGSAPNGMWRFSEHLPIRDPSAVVTFSEGDTPVVPTTGPTLIRLPVGSIRLKAKYRNPAGSFKDRIAAVAAALIRQGGMGGAVGTSSGNGGAAVAAYEAQACFPAILFTLSDIVDGKLSQILAHGATAHIIEAGGTAGGEGLAPRIARLAEEHPDASDVYVPGRRRAARLDVAGLPAPRRSGTRLMGVQPKDCPTLTRDIASDLDRLDRPVSTIISGLQVAVLFDYGAVGTVAASGGRAVEIDDRRAWKAQALLAREESLFGPAGATALAGLLTDTEVGRVGLGDDVVVALSGAGHEDRRRSSGWRGGNRPVPVAADQVAAAFEQIRSGR